MRIVHISYSHVPMACECGSFPYSLAMLQISWYKKIDATVSKFYWCQIFVGSLNHENFVPQKFDTQKSFTMKIFTYAVYPHSPHWVHQ